MCDLRLWGYPMTATTIRPIVEAFYRASAERDIERVMSLIADDVNWLVQGPVDVFAFFGQRHGKACRARGLSRDRAQARRSPAMRSKSLLVDGDRAAAMIRLTSIVRATGKVMSVRTSQFSRYRDGKIVEMRACCDSYDMVEQTLGRPLDVCRAANSTRCRRASA